MPFANRKRLTVLGALGLEGFEAVMTSLKATSAEVFESFLSQKLVPSLRQKRKQGDIVIMDNLSAHKGDRVRTLSEAAGFQLQYLPPYSPDLSPIEPSWSKIKQALRAQEARSLEALDQQLPVVLRTVTPQDARGWFRYRGYQTPN